MEELLEDRCYLPVHSFQLGPNGSLRVCYHIPVAIRPSAYAQKPYALNFSNFFNVNTDLVDMAMVIQYSHNQLKKELPFGVVL